jgi:choline dehydrogenase-like flavoprotein
MARRNCCSCPAIGDAAQLRMHGIASVLDLPAVGRNLHDHPAAAVAMRTDNTESYGLSWRTLPRAAWIGAQYLFARSGPLASNVFEANGFMRSRPDVDRPDLQVIFMPAHRNANGHWLPRGHGYGIIFVNLRPFSRGSVTLASSDPFAKPAIDFNFLADPRDMEVLVKGFEMARQVLGSQAFAPAQEPRDPARPGGARARRDRSPHPAHAGHRASPLRHLPHRRCGGREAAREGHRGLAGCRRLGHSHRHLGKQNIPVNAIAERGADLIRGRIP